ncbi:MAG TPA: amidohydrolase family protein [Vicinamibacterales bacterium]|jgi:predicted TIM-barrel fold metal-dependent hydrolase|nr:amidohydrolase family protein [Vicinamibacterales bacterium]
MNLSRRDVLLGVLAAGGHAALARAAAAQASPRPYRIDIHHHFAPPAWVTAVKGRPLLQPANTTWTPAKSIEDMDKGGVAAAMVSITNPGLWFGDAPMTRALARACNDYGATLVRDHPARFGLFAAVPLPDADGSLREIEYALDTLKADGIGLFTSYGDRWLGHADFRPVMEELHRRKAVVHVHPTAANCCRNLDYAPGVGPGSLEYGTDTTRAITGVAFSGDAERFPGIRFIWSHAGGTAPFLASRIDGASRGAKERMPAGFMATLKTFYYDLAGATNAGAVASLLQLVPPAQVLFGTDFPPGGAAADYVTALRGLKMFSESALRAVERDNAVRLLPRLASS